MKLTIEIVMLVMMLILFFGTVGDQNKSYKLIYLAGTILMGGLFAIIFTIGG